MNEDRGTLIAICLISAILLSSIFLLPSQATSAPGTSGGSSLKTMKQPLGAGYGVSSSSGSVTGVSVSFVIPKVTCNSTAPTGQAVYFVAALDGLKSSDFEYVGVGAYCQQGPNPVEYFALASSANIYDHISGEIPVKLGDTIEASIEVSSGTLHLTFSDITTGRSAANTASASGLALNFGSCLVGMGSPLAKFAKTSIGEDYTLVPSTCDATVNGVSQHIGDFTGSGQQLWELVMVNGEGTRVLAIPSALSYDGSSFTVTWQRAD